MKDRETKEKAPIRNKALTSNGFCASKKALTPDRLLRVTSLKSANLERVLRTKKRQPGQVSAHAKKKKR